jgi:hypothetical protein
MDPGITGDRHEAHTGRQGGAADARTLDLPVSGLSFA